MNFRLFNFVQGVTSLVSWRQSFKRSVREIGELAQHRASTCGIPLDTALNLSFFERQVGQIGYTLAVSFLLATIVYLAALHAAPEWVLCLLAMVPGTTLLLALWLERKLKARWSQDNSPVVTESAPTR